MDSKREQIPDTAAWENWILQLSEGLREMLQMTAASVLAGLGGAETSAVLPAVSVSGSLTERIVSGGEMLLPFAEERAAVPEEPYPVSSLRQGQRRKQVSPTPYETARELQKQSELLLRT